MSNERPNGNIQKQGSINQFVKAVGEQDYAKANEQLTKTINNKLENKIAQLKDINIFKDK